MVIGLDGFIEQRTEKLFVSDEYKIFFLTGQSDGGWRRAYITAKAFHTMDDDTRERMAATAEPWDATASRVTITPAQGKLSFYDGCTGTTSTMPLSELDADVQLKLQGKLGDPFAKYAAPSKPAADAGEAPAKSQSQKMVFKL
jgi:hypothetical protein